MSTSFRVLAVDRGVLVVADNCDPLRMSVRIEGANLHVFYDNWVPVADRLPVERDPDSVERTWPESDRVLVRLAPPERPPYHAFACTRRGVWHPEGHSPVGAWHPHVTHWMPLVEPQR